MKILFIDDDSLRTNPLREGLEIIGGIDIKYEDAPHNAVKEYKKNQRDYKAIILDIMLPHYDIDEYKYFSIPKYFPDNHNGMYTGLRVLLQLQEIMEHNKYNQPIIILTCIEDINKYIRELKFTGELKTKPANILTKPIFLSDFIKEVKSVLKN